MKDILQTPKGRMGIVRSYKKQLNYAKKLMPFSTDYWIERNINKVMMLKFNEQPGKIVNADYFFNSLQLILLSREREGKLLACLHKHAIKYDSKPADLLNKFSRRIFSNRVESISKLSEIELRNLSEKSFNISTEDLLSANSNKDFFFGKINHGFWEHITTGLLNKEAEGRYRQFNTAAHQSRYFGYNFTDFLGELLLYVTQKENLSFELAISFGAGNQRVDRMLAEPMNHVMQGAMVGANAFFQTIFNDSFPPLKDGGAPKHLFYQDQLHEFSEKINTNFDSTLFIVPNHLRSIAWVNGTNEDNIFPIPSESVHEVLPVILPALIDFIKNQIIKHKRLCICTQAGVASAVFAAITALIKEDLNLPDHVVHFYDLGLVLDLADLKKSIKQPWAKNQIEQSNHSIPFTLR